MRPATGPSRTREWLTLFWLLGWGMLLWSVHRPWWLLGGWIDARIFWAERAALYASPVLGFLLGACRRRRLIAGGRAGAWPWLIVPGLTSMISLLLIFLLAAPEILGVATTALCGFTAGGLTAGWGLLLNDDIPDLPTIRDSDRLRRQKDGSGW